LLLGHPGLDGLHSRPLFLGKPPGYLKLLSLGFLGPAGRVLRVPKGSSSMVPDGGRLSDLGPKPVTCVCLNLSGER
jgi:hypothetical protein